MKFVERYLFADAAQKRARPGWGWPGLWQTPKQRPRAARQLLWRY